MKSDPLRYFLIVIVIDFTILSYPCRGQSSTGNIVYCNSTYFLNFTFHLLKLKIKKSRRPSKEVKDSRNCFGDLLLEGGERFNNFFYVLFN